MYKQSNICIKIKDINKLNNTDFLFQYSVRKCKCHNCFKINNEFKYIYTIIKFLKKKTRNIYRIDSNTQMTKYDEFYINQIAECILFKIYNKKLIPY